MLPTLYTLTAYFESQSYDALIFRDIEFIKGFLPVPIISATATQSSNFNATDHFAEDAMDYDDSTYSKTEIAMGVPETLTATVVTEGVLPETMQLHFYDLWYTGRPELLKLDLVRQKSPPCTRLHLACGSNLRTGRAGVGSISTQPLVARV